MVVTTGLKPIRKKHSRTGASKFRFGFRIQQGFGSRLQDFFRFPERARVLTLRCRRGFGQEIELQELLLVPAVHAAVEEQGQPSVRQLASAKFERGFLHQ